jgi:hypothetical protein
MQLVTLKSSTKLLTDNNLVYSDSLVRITYNFYSPNGQLKFRIFNNYSKPIYIDWKNSMYIASSNNRQSYWSDKSTFKGSTQATDIAWTSWLSTNSGTIQGDIMKPERITFLPPGTEVEVSKYHISNGEKLEMPIKNETLKEKINWKKSEKLVEIKHTSFDIDNTPLNFRNYLTISLSEDVKEPIHYDFGFWISELQEMNAKQLVGDFLYQTNMDSVDMNSNYHPYKMPNRFFISEK